MKVRLLAAALSAVLAVSLMLAPAAQAQAVAEARVLAAAKAKAQERKAVRAVRRCQSPLVRDIFNAGFRGEQVRIAYAIVMRESHGRSLNESSRWYTGALGAWQIQTSAHSRKSWWSRSAMLHRPTQTRLVYLHLSERGRNWSHWGINRSGTGMDTRYYSRWSTWQKQNWIWAPYVRHRNSYPASCRGVLNVRGR